MKAGTQTIESWVDNLEDVEHPDMSVGSDNYYAKRLFKEVFSITGKFNRYKHEDLYKSNFLYRVEHSKEEHGNYKTQIRGLTSLLNSNSFNPDTDPSFQSFLQKNPDLLSYCLLFSTDNGEIDPTTNPGKQAWKKVFEHYSENKPKKYWAPLATSFLNQVNPVLSCIRSDSLYSLGFLVTGLSCGMIPGILFTDAITRRLNIKSSKKYFGLKK